MLSLLPFLLNYHRAVECEITPSTAPSLLVRGASSRRDAASGVAHARGFSPFTLICSLSWCGAHAHVAFLSFFPVKVPKIEIYIESSNILKFKFRKLKLQILFSSKFKISEVSKSHTSFRFQKLGKTFRKPIVRFLKVAKNEHASFQKRKSCPTLDWSHRATGMAVSHACREINHKNSYMIRFML